MIHWWRITFSTFSTHRYCSNCLFNMIPREIQTRIIFHSVSFIQDSCWSMFVFFVSGRKKKQINRLYNMCVNVATLHVSKHNSLSGTGTIIWVSIKCPLNILVSSSIGLVEGELPLMPLKSSKYNQYVSHNK